MPIDVETVSTGQLENLIVNHREKRATNAPLYRELADANGADWSQVRYAIGGHLWKLAEYGHLKERLLLSAIVVNKPNVETGKMEPDTLKGFIGAARELGYPITDEQAFLKEQQARVFAWARRESTSPPQQ